MIIGVFLLFLLLLNQSLLGKRELMKYVKMEFGEFLITCIVLISITFSQNLNPVGKNGMKIKIEVQRPIGKIDTLFYLDQNKMLWYIGYRLVNIQSTFVYDVKLI